MRLILTALLAFVMFSTAAQAEPISAALLGFALPGLTGTALAIGTTLLTAGCTALSAFCIPDDRPRSTKRKLP